MPLDRFTKRHIGNWAIVLLVVLNLLVIGTFWVTQLRRPPLPRHPTGNDPCETEPGVGEIPDILPFIARELRFSPRQLRQLRSLREETMPEIREEWQEMHQLRRQVHANLFREDMDPNQIQQWAERIGELQAKLEWTKYEHLIAVKSICTPRQSERLQRLLSDVMTLTRPPGHPRRGGPGRGGPGGRRGPMYGPGGPGRGGFGPRGPGREGPYGPPPHLDNPRPEPDIEPNDR